MILEYEPRPLFPAMKAMEASAFIFCFVFIASTHNFSWVVPSIACGSESALGVFCHLVYYFHEWTENYHSATVPGSIYRTKITLFPVRRKCDNANAPWILNRGSVTTSNSVCMKDASNYEAGDWVKQTPSIFTFSLKNSGCLCSQCRYDMLFRCVLLLL